MTKRGLRIPMILKFLLGCLTLAGLLILGGYMVVRSETGMKSRGDYLAKHFKRYLNYQDGLGQAVSSIADREANEPELRKALTPRSLVAGEPPQVDTKRASAIISNVFEILAGENSIKPDLMVLFDKNGQMIWASPNSTIQSADMRELEAVARVRTGSAFFNKMLIHRGAALQIAGVPVRAEGSDEVVGGIIVGVDVIRYMKDYKEQSDENEKMQYRLVLVHDRQVVTTVFPDEVTAELGQQLDESQWGHVMEGSYPRAFIRLRQGDYDFYVSEVEGFAGLQTGKVAQLFLLRSRSNLVGRGPTFPLMEIIIGIILSVLISLLLAMWITRPIKMFVRQSQKILEGETDLTQRIQVRSHDETQDLADNINQVFERLYRLASEVQGASFQVGASSAEISAASKEMLGGLKDQTLKVEGSTAAVTELSASIQQVAANAVEASKVAEKSNVAVTEAQTRMQQIRAAVEEAAERMEELGESSKRIGNIVEVIRQISEQTSLLALNASIEAAHAGEQGRGFAVVADEVSSLARRVGQSAKDIEALIQTIREQTADAVHSMQVGSSEVEGGTELVTRTLADLKQLIAVVNDTAAAVQEQAQVSDEIARNMDAVQHIANEVLSGSEESVIQAEQLHELAFQLEQSVGGFNLDAGTASRSLPIVARPALEGSRRRPR
ncbi:MAG TPA: methyl-accepting chemotaxis protein [Kofleriaceae bacterium]|nr:methyl-accepting chemotaxis protein [Kofleriaceae bacterium]